MRGGEGRQVMRRGRAGEGKERSTESREEGKGVLGGRVGGKERV